MNLLKFNKAEDENCETTGNLFLNSNVLNKDELKQIKGGDPGGDEDDVDELIDPE